MSLTLLAFLKSPSSTFFFLNSLEFHDLLVEGGLDASLLMVQCQSDTTAELRRSDSRGAAGRGREDCVPPTHLQRLEGTGMLLFSCFPFSQSSSRSQQGSGKSLKRRIQFSSVLAEISLALGV